MRHVLWVGAFPPPKSRVVGGTVRSCEVLLQSSFAARARLTLVDSTQVSNPPPGLLVRALLAARRMALFAWKFESTRPEAVLLFASAGPSIIEKGLMAWYARLRGVAAVLFPRGGPVMDAARASGRWKAIIRFCFRGAHVVLCQGAAWQRFAVEELSIPASRTAIVPNWTATEDILAIGRRRVDRPDGMYDTGSCRPRLLYVGWVNEEKGVLDLLDAAHILLKSRAFLLVVVGDGTGATEVRERIAANGAQGNIETRGWLSGDDLLAEYAAADIFVLPSWSEGFPNALIEAMACRLACVATSVGAIPDLLRDRREALLVPAREPLKLAEAIAELLDDMELRRKLRDAAFELAEREFSAEPAAERILSAIETAIARARGNEPRLLGHDAERDAA